MEADENNARTEMYRMKKHDPKVKEITRDNY